MEKSLWQKIQSLQSRIEQELDEYYDAFDPGTERLLAGLNQMMETREFGSSYEKKTAMHEFLCETCEIHLFRELPFFFEIASGRERYIWGGLQSEVGLYFQNRDRAAWRQPYLDVIREDCEEGLFHGWSPVGLDHHCPNYDLLLQKGISGILADAEKYLVQAKENRQKAFYESVIRSNRALLVLIGRFEQEALRLADASGEKNAKAHYQQIAETAAQLRSGAPQTLAGALSLIVFYRECVGSIEGIGISTFGHLDRLLYPYYRQDLAAGRVDEEGVFIMLCQLLWYIQVRFGYHKGEFHETSTTIEIGGCDREGNLIWNELTEKILDAVLCVRSNATKINCRVSTAHPRAFLQKIAQVQLAKLPTVMLHNDEVLIPARVRWGQEIADARLYLGCGCHEIVLAGTEVCTRADSWINLPGILCKSLEKATEYDSYEAFYAGFLEDAQAYHEKIAGWKNRYEKCWCEYDPLVLFSSSITGCLENGKDVTEGGAKYNTTMLSMVGTATLIDSLYAIRQLVFEEKRLTLQKLCEILKNNYLGMEELRQYVIHKLPKHGTNNEELNLFSAGVLQDLSRINAGRNARGGAYMTAFYPHETYRDMGKKIGATPDGRMAGMPLARGVSPSEFVRTDSVLDIIHSLKMIDFTGFADSFCAEITLPVLPADKDGEQILTSIMEAFLDAAGSSLQFNLLDREELLDAKRNPAAHAGLMVRVCGYSAAFTALKSSTQDEIIERAIR